MSKSQILITRTNPQAQQWANELEKHGISSKALPLIEIAAIKNQPQIKPQDYNAIMFVSPQAVAHFCAGQKEKFWKTNKIRAWSPGLGTKAELINCGWAAEQIDTPRQDAKQFDTQNLWENVSGQIEKAGFKLLQICGQDEQQQTKTKRAPREWLEEKLKEKKASLTEHLAYARAAPELSEEQKKLAKKAQTPPWIWLLSSSQAIENLQKALPDINLNQALAIATHPVIARAAQKAGFKQIRQTLPTLQNVVDEIKKLENDNPAN